MYTFGWGDDKLSIVQVEFLLDAMVHFIERNIDKQNRINLKFNYSQFCTVFEIA